MLSARLWVNEVQVLHRDLGAPCVDEKRPIAALHQGLIHQGFDAAQFLQREHILDLQQDFDGAF
jgi:hypothetical protein